MTIPLRQRDGPSSRASLAQTLPIGNAARAGFAGILLEDLAAGCRQSDYERVIKISSFTDAHNQLLGQLSMVDAITLDKTDRNNVIHVAFHHLTCCS